MNGSDGTAYLSSNSLTSGVYLDPDLKQNESNGILISTISANSTSTLKLNGQASKGLASIEKPIQDRFTLILKIKKSEKNK